MDLSKASDAHASQPKKSWLRKCGLLLGVLVGLVSLAIVSVLMLLKTNEHKLQQAVVIQQEFVVRPGTSQKMILAELEKAKIIECALCLEIHTRIFNPLKTLKAGTYQFDGSYSPLGVIKKIAKGEIVEFKITLVEGKTLDDWLHLLWAHPRIEKTLAGDTRDARYAAVQAALELEIYPEGLFLPETYTFADKTSEVMILKRAYGLQKKYIEVQWLQRQDNLPIETIYEALILASIVEKETGDPAERPIIAGVFINRLNRGMRLETDPTVIYGIKDYKGNITRTHLRELTPYNTYRIPRLPPTPIAAASRESIYAVLQPQSTDAIFFVARGDGTHVFSQTLQQHNKAVAEYQLNRRKDYRSAPQIKSESSANAN